ncbi:MAG: Nucleotidyltransferase/DNA polymerase involved in DNA repair [Candidatus Gottesmanbacteria bacterium GW2011_GWA1_43_11]|uniref:Nucleotidyltransferase/DNA polymerase involved in DNA repair n=1 Tax=Candidatus Gottesmanbacteria bacterium GW2011_GWA1_43_11 TaxID=1618436 RepID=A0A0G1CDN0_9BACT|nr:MAG: Nucleotidyltransferase/DNA polymerase involved in DNA repair [Candidatus Gottesmanbacteria bacterium GW2011_GWA1_43_11]
MQQFNSSLSSWMHVDLNSCFATIEQQANPHLRGRPIAVAAYTTPRGCILAPSVEAKRFGVKTGMQVREGKSLCPHLLILPSDPPKYRFVNQALTKLFNEYTPAVSIRSIDEMLLNFTQFPPLKIRGGQGELCNLHLITIAREIKTRIKSEIGEWLTVSIGIATNPYLAKLAAGLHKPDGLDEINSQNILPVLSALKLIDLPYIKERNQIRLNSVGIKTPIDFYYATQPQLKAAFQSINGYYWHLRLHGENIDEVEWQRKSIGHQYALPKRTSNVTEVEQLLCKLIEKVGRRLRRNNLTAQGIHLSLGYDHGYWHKGRKLVERIYTTADLFNASKQLLREALPLKPVRSLSVTCFNLAENLYTQTCVFTDEVKKRALTQALDRINDRWGEFSIAPATMLGIHREGKVLDRIAFSGVRDLAEVVLKEDESLQREDYITTL